MSRVMIARREVYGYLGYPKDTLPDTATVTAVEKACAAIEAAAQIRTCACQVTVAQLAPVLLGEDIHRHLEGCTECLLLGITLGVQVDKLLRTAGVLDMNEAVTLDCAASVLAEQAIEQFYQAQKEAYAENGMYLTVRFSPGYGDFPIAAQGCVLQLLDAGRKIGLTATENSILVPRKSVTAVCGIAATPVTGALAGCKTCALKGTCKLRKEGKRCGDF